MPKKIITLDATTLNNFQLCEGKFYYTNMLNRVPKVTPDYFEKGDLIHIMCKSYYRIRAAREKWKKHYTHQEILDKVCKVGIIHATTLELSTEDSARIIATFCEYSNFWANDGWIPLFVEEIASRVIYEDDDYKFIMTGLIDLVIEDRQLPNGLRIVDHKSSERRRKLSELSNQFMCYSWLLGCYHVTVNKIGFQKTLKPEEKFTREQICYDAEKLDFWVENTVKWIQRIIYAIEHDDYLYNFTSCDKFGGCHFQSVCERSPSTRLYHLERQYKVSIWDPSQKLREVNE